MRRFVLTFLLLLALPSYAETFAVVSDDPDGDGPFPPGPRVSGRLVIDFREPLSSAELSLWGRQYGVTPEWVLASHGLATIEVDENRVPELLQILKTDVFLEAVSPDYLVSATTVSAFPNSESTELEPARGFPNDPRFKDQWHLGMLGAQKAWKKANGEGITVAVVDSGIAYADKGPVRAVEDMAETRFVEGYDFVNMDKQAVDDSGYGTHIAGTVAQSTNNGIGVSGLAYKATLKPVKVMNKDGHGSLSACAAGIRFAADQGSNIILMGFGTPHDSLLLESAVEYASEQGALLVCGVGVEAQPEPGFPAAYPQVIGVGAVDIGRKITSYSNKGADITAPGGYAQAGFGILQNTIHQGNPKRDGYLWLAGNNCAAANVAGTAALVMSIGVKEPSEVRQILLATAKKQRDKESYGAGIVQADKAVAKAGKRDEQGTAPAWLLLLTMGIGWALRRLWSGCVRGGDSKI